VEAVDVVEREGDEDDEGAARGPCTGGGSRSGYLEDDALKEIEELLLARDQPEHGRTVAEAPNDVNGAGRG
jgi:hypothetical protein